MKYIIPIFLVLYTFLAAAKPVSAEVYVAQTSAQLTSPNIIGETDYRVERLKNFLEKNNSPLSPYAAAFVQAADKYDLDYRLVPAITGVESSFGKRIPKGSFNAYGWANGNFRFSSWEESIEVVSKTLRQNYIDRGATSVYAIGRIYAPPSKTWAYKVKYLMRKIDPLGLDFDLEED